MKTNNFYPGSKNKKNRYTRCYPYFLIVFIHILTIDLNFNKFNVAARVKIVMFSYHSDQKVLLWNLLYLVIHIQFKPEWYWGIVEIDIAVNSSLKGISQSKRWIVKNVYWPTLNRLLIQMFLWKKPNLSTYVCAHYFNSWFPV